MTNKTTNPTSDTTFVVDMSDEHSATHLYQNLRNNGFAILTNHHVSLHLLDDFYRQWSNFFSNDEKNQWIRFNDNDEGYIPMNTEKAVGYEAADYKEFYQTHWHGRYPDFIDLQSTKILVDQLMNLGVTLIELIDSAMPSSIKATMIHTLSEMITDSDRHGFRVLHYPPIPPAETRPRAAAHGDICLLTMLPSPTSRGLKLQDRKGVWHVPEMETSNIIVFNSDMIDLCTNGHLKSTPHQVCTKSDDANYSRFSFPIFIHPRREVELQKGLTALDALRKRLSEIGYEGHLLTF